MEQEIEIEFKNILTHDEYTQLVSAFLLDTDSFNLQENHYFDTKTFELKKKGSALRIRLKNEEYILTLKQPAEVGLLESHQPLAKEEALSIIRGELFINGDMVDLIKKLGINPHELRCFGSLETKRSEVIYKEGTLVLDHSYYLGMEDYEVEYEVADHKQGHEDFLQLLNTFKIPLRKTDNKIQRFYRASQDRK
jgi:uncharacterized protein YjbK